MGMRRGKEHRCLTRKIQSNTGVGVKQLAFEGGAESSVGTEWSCWKEAAKPPSADGLGVSRKLGKCCKCLQGSTLAKRRGGLAGCAVPIPGCAVPIPGRAVPTVLTSPMRREHHRDAFVLTLGFCNKICKKLHLSWEHSPEKHMAWSACLGWVNTPLPDGVRKHSGTCN